MRVEKINVYQAVMTLHKPFRIAYGETREAKTVFIEVVTDTGVNGWGEAPPTSKITGETVDTVVGAIRLMAGSLYDLDITGYMDVYRVIDATLRSNQAAKDGLVTAILDAVSKSLGTPLYKLLGGGGNIIRSDVTIGLDSPEAMARDAVSWVERGFRAIKVKLGGPLEIDFERVRMIRDSIGAGVEIRVDANQAWSPKEALKASRVLERYDVAIIEQPVHYRDYEGLRTVKWGSSIPIIADESVHTSRDAALLASMEAVDGVNVKIAKSGGMLEGLRIASVAEAFGLDLMVGCMVESPLGIAAAAHMVAAHGGFKYIDLDSDLMLSDHPVRDSFRRERDEIILGEKPGLGVEVDVGKLVKLAEIRVSKPQPAI
ncbi:MAG: dipeptide epimerase [Desulfurococcales archaeon]|nr:dipeptide epimerase [Desulfurococcales archaeon]